MSTYNTDFYAWTQETAKLLKQGRFSEIDMAALIEEVESMGKSEFRELRSRLIVLLMYLLKWQHQPKHRGNSWEATIKGQRLEVSEVLKENPSLKPRLAGTVVDAYIPAVLKASSKTNLATKVFPPTFAHTGWTVDQVLAETFYPEP